MFHAMVVADSGSASVVYTQEDLFKRVVLPAVESYPEIIWFADEHVAATSEGIASGLEKSWTVFLVDAGLLENKGKKYIKLERMLHSLVCFYLLTQGEPKATYLYWTQAQATAPFEEKDFYALCDLTKRHITTPDAYQAIQASLVYSDLGKTPEAKRRAASVGINEHDHDDFMAAVYSAHHDIRAKIIPSFAKLPALIQEHVLALHLAVPLHWGRALHLEGGESMFSRLVACKGKTNPVYVTQAFIIQVCDVAASQAHVNPQGFTAFNQQAYWGYQTVLEVVEKLLEDGNARAALLYLTKKKAQQLGYLKDISEVCPQNLLILARVTAFLRFYTEEQGTLLRNAAVATWRPEHWATVEAVFGLESGINTWALNPSYMPTVVLNIFNNPAYQNLKYQKALEGMLVLAELLTACQQAEHHASGTRIELRLLAAQAKTHPEWFTEQFRISKIDWQEGNIVIVSVAIRESLTPEAQATEKAHPCRTDPMIHMGDEKGPPTTTTKAITVPEASLRRTQDARAEAKELASKSSSSVLCFSGIVAGISSPAGVSSTSLIVSSMMPPGTSSTITSKERCAMPALW